MGEDGGAGKCPFHGLGWVEIGGWGAVAVAAAIGALLAGVFLLRTRSKVVGKKRKRGAVVADNGNGTAVQDDTGLDAIIVGAGVAGSALAYTLGKVKTYSPISFARSLRSRMSRGNAVGYQLVEASFF